MAVEEGSGSDRCVELLRALGDQISQFDRDCSVFDLHILSPDEYAPGSGSPKAS